MPPANRKRSRSLSVNEAKKERKIDKSSERDIQDEFEVEKILNFGQSKQDPDVSILIHKQ